MMGQLLVRLSKTSSYRGIHIGLHMYILTHYILMGFHHEQPEEEEEASGAVCVAGVLLFLSLLMCVTSCVHLYIHTHVHVSIVNASWKPY